MATRLQARGVSGACAEAQALEAEGMTKHAEMRHRSCKGYRMVGEVKVPCDCAHHGNADVSAFGARNLNGNAPDKGRPSRGKEAQAEHAPTSAPSSNGRRRADAEEEEAPVAGRAAQLGGEARVVTDLEGKGVAIGAFVDEPFTAENPIYWLPKFADELEEFADVGLTDDEAIALAMVARAAREVLRLDTLHPSDQTEMAQAFHVIQARLFARPAYRAYIDRGTTS